MNNSYSTINNHHDYNHLDDWITIILIGYNHLDYWITIILMIVTPRKLEPIFACWIFILDCSESLASLTRILISKSDTTEFFTAKLAAQIFDLYYRIGNTSRLVLKYVLFTHCSILRLIEQTSNFTETRSNCQRKQSYTSDCNRSHTTNGRQNQKVTIARSPRCLSQS